MKINRAKWIDNFEDGTFETYWEANDGTGDVCDIYLQHGMYVKDGSHSLKAKIDLVTSGWGEAEKKWTSPQIDLSDEDRIYLWGYTTNTGKPKLAIRNNTSWGSWMTAATSLNADEWTLIYFTLSGTRDQVDGIKIRFEEAEFGTSAETIYIDTIVAVRTDTNHQYDFSLQQEDRLTKNVERELIRTSIPGRNITFIGDRGCRARLQTLAGEFNTTADRQNLIDVLRGGDNLFLFQGVAGRHGIVVRLQDILVQQLSGIVTYYPYTVTFIESLERSL